MKRTIEYELKLEEKIGKNWEIYKLKDPDDMQLLGREMDNCLAGNIHFYDYNNLYLLVSASTKKIKALLEMDEFGIVSQAKGKKNSDVAQNAMAALDKFIKSRKRTPVPHFDYKEMTANIKKVLREDLDVEFEQSEFRSMTYYVKISRGEERVHTFEFRYHTYGNGIFHKDVFENRLVQELKTFEGLVRK